jgi:hypothetical protein
MKCENCKTEIKNLLVCECCGHEYCVVCQPNWDTERDWCGACQELETIHRLSEGSYTGKLRKRFSKSIKVEQPDVVGALPWVANKNLLLSSSDAVLAKFQHHKDCEYAARSASRNHQLMLVLAAIHERIRLGKAWYDGSEADVVLWQKVKELLK